MRRPRLPLPAHPGQRALVVVALTLLAVNLLAYAVDALVPSPEGPRSSAFATAPEGVAAWADLARRSGREDPAALERAADAAEREERWEEAVRLRFRAGLLRLDARRIVGYRPSLTTGEVRRALGSPAFDAVGRDFDAIAYGGRAAGPDDAGAARAGWAEVLSAAEPR